MTMTGGCLCGAIRYEVDGRVSSYWLCHCSKCRRVSGGPFATAALCRIGAFRFVSGEDEIRTFESDSGYATSFCGRCGSPTPSVREDEGHVVLTPGTLDAGYAGRLVRHIFVGSKAGWDVITDDIPQFEAMPPGYE